VRRLWLGLGSMLTVAALVLATAGVWDVFANARPPVLVTSRAVPFERSQLALEVAQGDVNVVVLTGDAGQIVIERRLRWSQGRPSVREDWDGRTLRLSASCGGVDRMNPPVCRADYTLFVPDEVDVTANTADGLLMVDGAHGDLRMTSVSGDMDINGTSGSLYARSGSGDVRARSLYGGHADVEIGTGRLSLGFREPPTNVRAVVRTRGDVSVSVPDAPYDVTIDAEHPGLDVKNDASSPRKIFVSAPEGFADVCCK
jgi:hypothetical protein